jgi:hypothetical protein
MVLDEGRGLFSPNASVEPSGRGVASRRLCIVCRDRHLSGEFVASFTTALGLREEFEIIVDGRRGGPPADPPPADRRHRPHVSRCTGAGRLRHCRAVRDSTGTERSSEIAARPRGVADRAPRPQGGGRAPTFAHPRIRAPAENPTPAAVNPDRAGRGDARPAHAVSGGEDPRESDSPSRATPYRLRPGLAVAETLMPNPEARALPPTGRGESPEPGRPATLTRCDAACRIRALTRRRRLFRLPAPAIRRGRESR